LRNVYLKHPAVLLVVVEGVVTTAAVLLVVVEGEVTKAGVGGNPLPQ